MLRSVLYILSPVAAAWLMAAGLAIFASGVGHLQEARLLADARPDKVHTLQVERLQLLSDDPEIWRAEGRVADGAPPLAVTLEPADTALLGELQGRLPVIETGDPIEPLVTARWYEEQPMLRIAGVVVPLHLVLGILFAGMASLQLLRVSRRDFEPRHAFVQSDATQPALSPAQAPLAARLERRAARGLPAFRWRVAAVAALGYGFLFGVVLLLAGTMLVGVQHALGEPYLTPLWLLFVLPAIVVGMLATTRAPGAVPEGEPIDRATAPALFARLDAIAGRVRGPRFDRILLTEEFNAAIVQRAGGGLAAWPRLHLRVGLPLMQALTAEQFEAVLAHEYGHVAPAVARFAGLVDRMRGSWLRLAGELERRWRWIGLPFRRFLAWYAPWFGAHAAVLARRNELAADRLAAGITSPRVMVDALAVVAVRGRQLDSAFWPNLYDGARFQPEPPAAYRALGVAMKERLAPDTGNAHLDAALGRRTRAGDTHPALIDRARALGERVRMPPVPLATAAETLLGASLDEILMRFDRRWAARCGEAWRMTYARAQHERALLTELETAAAAGELSLKHRWCRARLTEQADDEAAAELMYLDILADAPDNAPAHFALARLLLARGDMRGLTHLDRAMNADVEAVVPGCELATHHLRRLGLDDEARGYRLRGALARRASEAARAERAGIALDDPVLPAGLDDVVLAAIRDLLAAEPGIERAWLVRKQLRHERGRPVMIVIVRAVETAGPDMVERLSKALWALRIEAEFWVVPDNAVNARLCGRAQAVAGSAIFARPQAGACS